MSQEPITQEDLIDCSQHLTKKLVDQKVTEVTVENGNVLVLHFDSNHKLFIGGATEIAIGKKEVGGKE